MRFSIPLSKNKEYFWKKILYRSKEEFDFQAHALQNHAQSRIFFSDIQKLESVDTNETEVKFEPPEEDVSGIKIDSFLEENGSYEEPDFLNEGKFSSLVLNLN